MTKTKHHLCCSAVQSNVHDGFFQNTRSARKAEKQRRDMNSRIAVLSGSGIV
jgi:hypothetical protein